MTDYPKVQISTSHGDLTVELWNDVAPGHVDNFLKLAGENFYDGLSFHRILEGFMIQGGCPNGDGTGGPGWSIDAEFNDRQHQPGTLSMARSSDPNSAGSQFFICLTRDRCQHLDGDYTAFGQVIDGMSVVEEIGQIKADPRSGEPKGQPPKINTVRTVEAE